MYYVILRGRVEESTASLYRDPTPEYGKKVPFYDGIKLGDLPPLTLHRRAGDQGVFTDYMGATPATMVVSSRFREALDSAGVDNVDYYPARIVDDASGKVADGYYAANIIGLVDCLDREKSTFTKMSGTPADFFGKNSISELKTLRLDAEKIRGAKIFRLFGRTSVIVVDEAVKRAIDNAGLRGVHVVAAEGMEGL